MRRRLGTAIPAALMAVMLVVGSALAGHGHATGGGTFVYLTLERLDFEAHDFTPNDDRDRGTAHYRNFSVDLEYTAKIVCALVTVDMVRFGYIIPSNDDTERLGIAGIEVVWEVRDGGSPGTGNDSAAWNTGGPGSGVAELCETYPVPPTANNVLNGNFTVHEAN